MWQAKWQDSINQEWPSREDWGEAARNGWGGASRDTLVDDTYDLHSGSDLILDLYDDTEIHTQTPAQTRQAEREFQTRLAAVSEQDTMMFCSVYDWVVEELRRREDVRGFSHGQSAYESHMETIAVLDELLIDLYKEKLEDMDAESAYEYLKLCSMIQAWRRETLENVPQYHELAV